VQPSLAGAYRQLPLAFEVNVGQTDPRVHYLARGSGMQVFLTDAGATFSLGRPGDPTVRDAFSLGFDGANPAPQFYGQQPLDSRSNYFVGSDPSGWHTDVENDAAVVVRDLYPGIDLTWQSGGNKQVEFALTVGPGAGPSAIRLRWQGLTSITTDQQGGLVP
jgi:hypothetical protein